MQEFPLSPGQERLWLMHHLAPSSGAYHVVLPLAFRSAVNERALRAALLLLIERHPQLCVTYHGPDDQGAVHQVVREPFDIPLETVGQAADGWGPVARTAVAELFNLSSAPPLRGVLVRGGPGPDVLLLVMHHLLVDGMSLSIMERDLAALYRASLAGDDACLPELRTTYADYVAGVRDDGHLEYWADRLRGFERTTLNTDFVRQGEPDRTAGHVAFEVPAELCRRLREFAFRERAALSSAVAAAFIALLARRTGRRDVTVGSVLTGRPERGFQDVVGFFSQTVALRADVPEAGSFRGLLRHVNDRLLEAHEHQSAPFERVAAAVEPNRPLDRNPVFDAAFVHQGERPERGDAVLRALDWQEPDLRFDLELDTVVDGDGRLKGTLGYRRDLYTEATIAVLTRQLVLLLRTALGDPDRSLADLDLLEGADRATLLEWGTATGAPPPERTFSDLFEAQVAATPDNIAAISAGFEVTYSELNVHANRLARRLVEVGARPEAVVAVAVPRSIDMVVAVLAVLKSGAAVLPIDLGYPPDRIDTMLADARPIAVIGAVPGQTGLTVVPVHGHRERAESNLTDADRSSSTDLRNAAFLYYTSGSTGRPKGVVVTHAGFSSIQEAQRSHTGAGPESRILQFASLSFDVSLSEMCFALLHGGALVLAPTEELLNPESLRELTRRTGVTHCNCTPSLLATLPVDVFPSGMTLIMGGEAPGPDLVRKWGPGRKLYNFYGPTEATIFATASRPLRVGETVRMGTPVSARQAFVLDTKLRPVAIGVPGELYLGGAGLARGYHERPALTSERFVPCPFGPPGAVLYRTGDVVRWTADGELEFSGRSDGQVKIRGFRIELGEVEHVLAEQPEVGQVVVVVRDEGPSDRRLVAYFVPAGEGGPTVGNLRRAAVRALPAHMVPAAFVEVGHLPLTANGKLDTTALPAPKYVDQRTGRPPRNREEKTVCTVIGAVLGVPEVGVEDNFFEIGGDSLLATRVVARLRRICETAPAIREFFRQPTAAAIAEKVTLRTDRSEPFTAMPKRVSGLI
ncbi:non-ribosomal peptide synthetase [Amycolatopsis sp. cmx-11-12]|uniref:non-ribosomal peptide synthetase n=1 Tax=Amycolatopsis sp. cmx-11-12 TaxID=2785795 RepID=UPI0039180DD3